MRGMTVLDLLTLVAALGCGLVAGVFFAFSSFVMGGLARLSAPEGVAAMQSINRTGITASFMLAWLGSGALCVAVAAWSVAAAGGHDAAAIAAAAIYVVGSGPAPPRRWCRRPPAPPPRTRTTPP